MPWPLLLAATAFAQVETVSLDEALRRLESDGPDLETVRARADAADAVTRQAAAAIGPIVVATGGYVRNNDEVVLSFSNLVSQLPVPLPAGTELPEDVIIQPEEAFNASLTVRVPLLAPSAYTDLAAARRQARAAEAGEEAARATLQAAVVRAAAAVTAAEGLTAASERAVGLAEQHRDLVARGVEVGTESRLSLLQAEGDVLRRRSELEQARADLLAAQESLGGLLGVEGPLRIELPDAIEAPITIEAPQLAAARLAVDAAKSRASSAWLSHLPSVSAYASGLVSTVPFHTGDDAIWRIGVDATWTLYDGGLRYGRLSAARAARREAEATEERERLRISRETADAGRRVTVARERLRLAEQQHEVAVEARRLAHLGLEAGTVSALEAREVEQRTFQADVSLEAARAQVLAATAALAAARGATW